MFETIHHGDAESIEHREISPPFKSASELLKNQSFEILIHSAL